MRFDLLEIGKQLCDNLTEFEFFDVYDSIFELRKGCRISSSNLINSLDAHRFCFISEDTINQNLPSMVHVTPYLHERRIYLRNRQPNKQYFMTSMDILNKARRIYNDTIFEQINGHSGS
jgi:hypothetical protein